MAPPKKQTPRERAHRQERAAAAAARRRAAKRRRAITVVIALAAVVAILFGLLAGRDDDEQDVATSASTTTVAPDDATGDAAGKPCVAQSGEAPPGAPPVPVEEGPPPTELVMEDLKEGEGDEVTPSATVTVHYIGVACSTGQVFDASYAGGEPATFPLTGVIPGWTNGIPGMKVGGQRLLGIPSDQAYGPSGRSGIAPNEALWFVVEVLDTQPA